MAGNLKVQLGKYKEWNDMYNQTKAFIAYSSI